MALEAYKVVPFCSPFCVPFFDASIRPTGRKLVMVRTGHQASSRRIQQRGSLRISRPQASTYAGTSTTATSSSAATESNNISTPNTVARRLGSGQKIKACDSCRRTKREVNHILWGRYSQNQCRRLRGDQPTPDNPCQRCVKNGGICEIKTRSVEYVTETATSRHNAHRPQSPTTVAAQTESHRRVGRQPDLVPRPQETVAPSRTATRSSQPSGSNSQERNIPTRSKTSLRSTRSLTKFANESKPCNPSSAGRISDGPTAESDTGQLSDEDAANLLVNWPIK